MKRGENSGFIVFLVLQHCAKSVPPSYDMGPLKARPSHRSCSCADEFPLLSHSPHPTALFISLCSLMPTGSFTVHFCNTYWVSNAEYHWARRAGFPFPEVFLYPLHICKAGLTDCPCVQAHWVQPQPGRMGRY